MPRAVLDPTRCRPERCDRGLCLARRQCPVKAVYQEEPFSVPFLNGAQCNGCSKCVAVCPLKAISLV